MQETQHDAQAKVDRHAALVGAANQHLPAGGTNGYALFWNSTTGKWEPGAVAGSGPAASRSDPLGLGFPYSFDPIHASASGGIGTANRTFYYRAIGGGSVSKIGLYIATSSGNICVSVYANSGTGRSAAPAARLASSGSVACPAAGYAEIALGSTVNVSSGDHWLAVALDNVTATLQQTPTSAFGAQGRMAWQDTAFPSPNPATPANGGGAGGGSRGFMLIGVP